MHLVIAWRGREDDPGHRWPGSCSEDGGRAELGTTSTHKLTNLPVARDASGVDSQSLPAGARIYSLQIRLWPRLPRR
eukprot:3865257-Heterocapsa_arctica.AAC.1